MSIFPLSCCKETYSGPTPPLCDFHNVATIARQPDADCSLDHVVYGVEVVHQDSYFIEAATAQLRQTNELTDAEPAPAALQPRSKTTLTTRKFGFASVVRDLIEIEGPGLVFPEFHTSIAS